MAEQLIDDMTERFEPAKFVDRFKEQVMALVEKKAKAGETETVLEPPGRSAARSADVIDLAELLQRSLKGGKGRKGLPRRETATSAHGRREERGA